MEAGARPGQGDLAVAGGRRRSVGAPGRGGRRRRVAARLFEAAPVPTALVAVTVKV